MIVPGRWGIRIAGGSGSEMAFGFRQIAVPVRKDAQIGVRGYVIRFQRQGLSKESPRGFNVISYERIDAPGDQLSLLFNSRALAVRSSGRLSSTLVAGPCWSHEKGQEGETDQL